jgi:hypothetical protein
MLEELGATPDAVANALRALGIQGVRNTVRFLNPVVRYAYALLPDVKSIDIILGDRLRIVFAKDNEQVVEVPEAVLRFLDAFHRGEYSDLEMQPGPG